MTLRACSIISLLVAGASLLPAQPVNGAPLTVPAPRKLTLQHGATAAAPIRVEVRNGYHVNSHKPTEEYLIPLTLEWSGGLESTGNDFPAPKMAKYSFSPQPIAVYTSDFTITAKFRAPKTAGQGVTTGRLRYQACTNSLCLPPKTVEIKLPYEVQ